jgi:hypothetical protein
MTMIRQVSGWYDQEAVYSPQLSFCRPSRAGGVQVLKHGCGRAELTQDAGLFLHGQPDDILLAAHVDHQGLTIVGLSRAPSPFETQEIFASTSGEVWSPKMPQMISR